MFEKKWLDGLDFFILFFSNFVLNNNLVLINRTFD